MKKTVALAALLLTAFARETSAAALTITSGAEVATEANFTWKWLLAENHGDQTFVFPIPLQFWDIKLKTRRLNELQGVAFFTVTHKTDPHTGEPSSGHTWSATVYHGGSTPVESFAHGTRHDEFRASVSPIGANQTATITLKAVHAIPEPQTYALMLAGLATVGLIAAKKGKSGK